MKSSAALSIKTITELSGETDYQVRKAVNSLVEANLLEKQGNGPSTKYDLALGSGELLTQLQLMVDGYRKMIQDR